MLSKIFVPDTFEYMYAGYAVLTVVLSVYLLSIFIRWKRTVTEFRKLQED